MEDNNEYVRMLARSSAAQIACFRGILAGRESLTAEGFEHLIADIVFRRLALAEGQLRSADLLASSRKTGNLEELLSAVSRAYFAMYNTARALVFLRKGKDVNEHRRLPDHLPEDLPDRDEWAKRLRKYRDLRNDADYDPFADWETLKLWHAIREDAGLFLARVRKLCRGEDSDSE